MFGLWLRIVSARNIDPDARAKSGDDDDVPEVDPAYQPVRSLTDKLFVAEVSIPNTRTILKTATAKVDIDQELEFNEEFFIPNADKLQKLTISLAVHSGVIFQSDDIIASGSVEVPASSDQLVDQWISLEDVAEVRVIAKLLSVSDTEGIQHVRCPPVPILFPHLRIVTDKQRYLPGEKVSGIVVFNVQEDRLVSQITLTARGFAHATWEPGNSNSSMWINSHQFFNCQKSFLQNSDADKPIMIAAGASVWPFRFQLPLDCAPSWVFFGGAIFGGEITYELKASLFLPNQPAKQYRHLLEVGAPAEAKDIKPVDAQASEAHGGLHLRHSQIVLDVQCPNTLYRGEKNPVRVSIVNLSPNDVASLEAYVLGENVMVGEDSSHTQPPTVDSIGIKRNNPFRVAKISFDFKAGQLHAKEDGFPVHEQRKWEGAIEVDIPWDTAPSINPHLDGCDFVQVTHKLKVAAATAGNFLTREECSVEIPIRIADRPLESAKPTVVSASVGAGRDTVVVVEIGKLQRETSTESFVTPTVPVLNKHDDGVHFILGAPLPESVFGASPK